MGKYEKADKRILQNYQDGIYNVDFKNGVIYLNHELDVANRKKALGKRNGRGISFSITVDNSVTSQYPINRAIYLCFHKYIPYNHKIIHINNNTYDNRIDNLVISQIIYEKANGWEKEDLDKLKELYQIKTLSELAKIFDRSEASIRQKLKDLFLIKLDKRRYWTENEDELIVDLYVNKKLSVQQIAKQINRSHSAISLRLSLKGIERKFIIRDHVNVKNFYLYLKNCRQRKTAICYCCLCNYSKTINLHHIDGNNKNHQIANIATVCPNCHFEIEYLDEHKDKLLLSKWQRVFYDGSKSEIMDNKKERELYGQMGNKTYEDGKSSC